MKNKKLALGAVALLITLLAGLNATAHGEDKPGPHGGQIRMPGAYHTEVIARPDGFQVYLLDISFQKPTVSNSHIKASLESNGKVVNLKCETHPDHFFCPVAGTPKRGRLIIESTRDNSKGNLAQYTLPL